VLSPVLFVDFTLFARELSAEGPTLHQLGRSFALAALFWLLMVFFHVFTSIYDYAPVVGPIFRDRFWLVYLLAGLGMGLPLLAVRNESFRLGKRDGADSFAALSVSVLATLSVAALYWTASRPVARPETERLKLMTYNIQQGFDALGNKNLEAQLAVIQRVGPDILGLQESDTARVANGNVDAVRYLADHLDMYSYYGPTTTTGTFGIALLSKYPIQNPATFFMYSQGEQTAAIHAELDLAGKTYHIFVTHLGNGGPIVQLEDLLVRIKRLENVIAMGDFNFRPSTDQYALMTGALADSWLLRWPGRKETAGLSMADRIDHIFVSPGMSVLESEYGSNSASDHPYLYSVIRP
jgi:endonuclease/exonuclease/phosphatase family metal-dependent hydrolase